MKIVRYVVVVFVMGLVYLVHGAVQSQTFDEDFSLWPVDLKTPGTIIVGGGIDLPDVANQLFSQIAIRDETHIVALVFESPDAESSVDFSSKWKDVDSVDIFRISPDATDLPEPLNASLDGATGIWISASGPLSQKQTELLGLHPERPRVLSLRARILAALEQGAVLCVTGFAAPFSGNTAVVQGGWHAKLAEGLHLIPDTDIDTDLWRTDLDVTSRLDRATPKDANQTHRPLLSALGSHPDHVGIHIDRGTAIVLQGRKIRAFGSGQATFMLMANEQKPLRVQRIREAPSGRANPYQYVIDLTAWRRDATDRVSEPFPPENPPTPHVENGTLMIVGGGGLPDGLMQQFAELAGGAEARLIYVPCTEREEVARAGRTVAMLENLGVKSATLFHTKDRKKANTDEVFLAPLKEATGIWFGGGRQWNFSDSYYGTTAHKLMKDVLQRGGVIGGSSAGASIQARYLARANPIGNIDIMAPGYERGGLGFIGGVAIDQHFTQRGRHKDMTQLVNRYPQLLGIGIDEGTALIVQKSIGEVTGRGRVFFYDRTKPVFPDQEDYTPLGAGGKFDLAKRAVIQLGADAAEPEDDN